MILFAATLRKLRPVSPFNERFVVNGKSAGLSSAGYDIRVAESHTLSPGKFVLGSSLERFYMPNDVIGIVHDKSSWIRMGLSVFNTVIECGWQGYLTLELLNNSEDTLVIEAGEPIAQVIFHQGDGTGNYNGKYNNQEAGPQKARYETC